MKLLAPQWLWLLAAIPLAYLALSFDQRRRKERFARFADPAVWGAIAPEIDWGARLRKTRIWLAALAFVALALARPQWGTHEEILPARGLDVMIVIDVSNSMLVEDMVPSRLKKAKHIVRNLVDQLEGDRVGVVAFAASAYPASPLTTDMEYLKSIVDQLSPASVTNQGTDIAIALEVAARALERGAVEGAASAPGTESEGKASKVAVLITDGEDHEGKGAELAKVLRANGTQLYVIGVGTEKGGPIPARDESGTLRGYKRDRKGESVISAFSPDTLLELANAAGGRYWNASTAETEVEQLLEAMGALDRAEYAERRIVVYEDRYQFPLAIAIALLLIELAIPARRLKTLAALAALLLAPSAFAAPSLSKQVPLDAYLANQEGLKALGDGKVEDARKKFGEAQAHDPGRPELHYNQGLARLQQGDVDGALQDLGQAARLAQQQDNPELSAEAFHNLGVALTAKGDTKKAARAYLQAINSAQAAKNAKLEDDARKNLELLEQKRQENKKKQQQQQDKQDQNQSQDPNQKQDPSDQDQQGSGQNQAKNEQEKKDQEDKKDGKDGEEKDKKDQPKPQDGQEQQAKDDANRNKKQQFKSEQMSDEDANRVMAELFSRESELRKKLGKQRGSQTRQEKDW